jgi:hypothetical protein
MSGRSGNGSSRSRPVERFLGPEFAMGGPFALLGVTPQACSEDLVLAGLDRQIEAVAQHPEADTPEADEVRLALHAAAAQLLDPVVRRHLIARWTRGSAPSAAPLARAEVRTAAVAVRAAEGAPTAARSHSMRLLEHDAILALAMNGGWNARALRRLVSLAHARGMTNDQVVAALRNLSNRRRSLAPGPGGAVMPGGSGDLSIGNRFVPGTTTDYPGVLRSDVSAMAAAPTPSAAQVSRQVAPPKPLLVRQGDAARHGEARQEAARQRALADATRPLTEQVDPADRLLKRAVLLGGIGLAGLLILMGLVYVLTAKGPAPAGQAAGPAAPAAPVAGTPTAAPEQRPRPDPTIPAPPAGKSKPGASGAGRTASPPAGDPAALVRELASIGAAAAVSPEDAADRFDEMIPRLAAMWANLPKDRLIAANDSVLEYIYRVSGSGELIMRAINTVAMGARALEAGPRAELMTAGQVLPAAWSSGMLARLSRERDLPATAKLFIDRELMGALGPARPSIDQTYDAGVLAAMYLIPHRLTPVVARGARADAALELEGWKEYLRAVQAMPGADAAQRMRLQLTALEVLLVHGPEPNANRSVAAVVGELTGRMTWRASDESRKWLLRWFADARISNADLNAVTSVLATKSAAEGVDLTMVLSTSAAQSVRADLRERYATVWSLQDAVSRDDLVAQWVTEARQAITESHLQGDELGELASAALLSRLNEAAYWHWRGDANEASVVLTGLRGPVELALAGSGGGRTGQITQDLSDGAWGERYLAARQNIKFRRELLFELESRQQIGPIDAEVLAGEALLGSPNEIRARAQEVALRFASDGAMINAVLERLPRAPLVAGTGSFMEGIVGANLPPVRDAEWGIRARRALVERLLEAVADESPMARIDRLGRVLRTSYRSMAAQAPLSGDERVQDNQPAGAVSAGQLWRAWRASADTAVPSMSAPLALEQIERRRSGRQGQAQGMVQEFAAEQVSLAELLAYLVAAEQPGRMDDIRLVLSDMNSERRRAKHISRQLNAAERAMSQLWLIRFNQMLTEQES